MKNITIQPVNLKWHEGMPLVDYRYFADTFKKGRRIEAQILDLGGNAGNPCYKVRILDDKKSIVNNREKIIFQDLEKAKDYAEMVIAFHCFLYI